MKKFLLIIFCCIFGLGIIHADVEWTLTEDGTLTISGEKMEDYGDVTNLPPWIDQGGIDPKKRIIIRKIVIKDGVTNIGREAFEHCSSLTSITIPNSVTSIGDDAFNGCLKLTSITIPNSVTTIGVMAFNNCRSLTSVTIPNSVTSLGNAFCNCTGLVSVTIPNSVTTIERGTFSNCPSLTSITIPNSVTYIEHEAFVSCPGLTSVTLPSSLTNMEYKVFEGCSSLTTLICYAIDPPTGESKFWSRETELNWFTNVPTTTGTLYVPASSISAYKNADGWKEWKNIKAIEDGVTTGLNRIVDYKTGDDKVYKLNGQRINGFSAQRGVFIKNGKKYAR